MLRDIRRFAKPRVREIGIPQYELKVLRLVEAHRARPLQMFLVFTALPPCTCFAGITYMARTETVIDIRDKYVMGYSLKLKVITEHSRKYGSFTEHFQKNV